MRDAFKIRLAILSVNDGFPGLIFWGHGAFFSRSLALTLPYLYVFRSLTLALPYLSVSRSLALTLPYLYVSRLLAFPYFAGATNVSMR